MRDMPEYHTSKITSKKNTAFTTFSNFSIELYMLSYQKVLGIVSKKMFNSVLVC